MLESVPATEYQIQSLTSGWNWYSTYIEQDNTDGLEALENSLGHKGVTIKSNGQFVTNYYENVGYDYWYGGLESIDNEQGYMINTSEACNVVLSGAKATPENHTITIRPNWNWIGYPVDQQQLLTSSISNTFQPANNDIMKSHGEFTTYYAGYGWYPNDFVMTPGKGYMYKSNSDTNKTLTYTVSREAMPEQAENYDYQWTPETNRYADNMSVIAVVEVEGDEMRENMEVGAFVNGECRGTAILRYFEPTDRYYAMLSVSGEAGDKVTFKLYDAEGENIINFSENAVLGTLDNPLVLRFGESMNITTDVSLYPNPVDKNTEFTLDIPSTEKITEVIITNAIGEIVMHEVCNNNVIKGISHSGVYNIRVITERGCIYNGRIIVK